MNTIQNETTKREYTAPQLHCISLDNEISLALQSAPPLGPGESHLQAPEFYNNDPYGMA